MEWVSTDGSERKEKWLWTSMVWESIMKIIRIEFISGYWAGYRILEEGTLDTCYRVSKTQIIISDFGAQMRGN